MKMPAGDYKIQYVENRKTDIYDEKYLVFHYFDNTPTTVKVGSIEELGYYDDEDKRKICFRDEKMKNPWFQIIEEII